MLNLNHSTEIENLLSIDYHTIARCDLNDDSCTLIYSATDLSARDLPTLLEELCERYVCPEEKEVFKENTSKSKLLGAMEGASLDFEVHRDDDYSYRVVFIPSGDDDSIGYLFFKYAN